MEVNGAPILQGRVCGCHPSLANNLSGGRTNKAYITLVVETAYGKDNRMPARLASHI